MSVRSAVLSGCALLLVATIAALRLQADGNAGHLAIIAADPAILQPGELFDLNGRTLTFTPRAGQGYDVSSSALAFDAAAGTPLDLADNGSVRQALAFSFPFFGGRDSVFINANGNVTFGAASKYAHFGNGSATALGSAGRSLDRLAGDLPRIAVLWQNWNPAAGGTVLVANQPDRLVVTWDRVALAGTTFQATFQLALYPDGTIRMHYGDVAFTPGGGFLVGLSPGARSRYLVKTLDLSAPGGGSLADVPADQAIAQVFGTSARPLVHLPEVSRRFLSAYGDDFDQLAVFTNFPQDLDGAFAYELTLRLTFDGVGEKRADISSFFGSGSRLQSVLNLGPLTQWPSDPNGKTVGTHTAMDVLGHETGHLWLAFASFDDAGVCSSELLGRQFAHWSFFHHTSASDMEGNEWLINADGTFTTIAATDRYSPLDQYLMGLRAPEDVPDFFLIRNPTGTKTRSSAPAIGVTIGGALRHVSLSDVTACEGSRGPAAGFSDVSPTTVWRQPAILVVKPDVPPASTDLSKLAGLRQAFVSYFRSATDGRGTLDPSLPVDLPDLAESTISPPPASILPGGSFQVTGTTVNGGNVTADASTTRYSLSFDSGPDASDVSLTGSRQVAALDPGDSSSGAATISVPSSTALGSYVLIACADAAWAVAESDEEDNCIGSSSRVTVGRPDLVSLAMSEPPSIVLLGQSWPVESSVQNIGTIAAPASTTRFYLSVDRIRNSGDSLVTGTWPVESLEPQQMARSSTTVKQSKVIPLGLYYVLACADDTKKVAEGDELNNCSVSASTVDLRAPDLIVSDVFVAETSAPVGGGLTIRETIRNGGNAGASPSTTRYYLSRDQTRGGTDYRLTGSRSVPALAPSEDNTAPAGITVPTSVPADTYYVIACADDRKTVSEASETNNCRASATMVTIHP